MAKKELSKAEKIDAARRKEELAKLRVKHAESNKADLKRLEERETAGPTAAALEEKASKKKGKVGAPSAIDGTLSDNIAAAQAVIHAQNPDKDPDPTGRKSAVTIESVPHAPMGVANAPRKVKTRKNPETGEVERVVPMTEKGKANRRVTNWEQSIPGQREEIRTQQAEAESGDDATTKWLRGETNKRLPVGVDDNPIPTTRRAVSSDEVRWRQVPGPGKYKKPDDETEAMHLNAFRKHAEAGNSGKMEASRLAWQTHIMSYGQAGEHGPCATTGCTGTFHMESPDVLCDNCESKGLGFKA